MAGPECKTGTTHHPTLSYRLTELLEALLTPVFLPLSLMLLELDLSQFSPVFWSGPGRVLRHTGEL